MSNKLSSDARQHWTAPELFDLDKNLGNVLAGVGAGSDITGETGDS